MDECDCCKLLMTVINTQNEISQRNKNLEKKFDLPFGATANCSEGKKFITRINSKFLNRCENGPFHIKGNKGPCERKNTKMKVLKSSPSTNKMQR